MQHLLFRYSFHPLFANNNPTVLRFLYLLKQFTPFLLVTHLSIGPQHTTTLGKGEYTLTQDVQILHYCSDDSHFIFWMISMLMTISARMKSTDTLPKQDGWHKTRTRKSLEKYCFILPGSNIFLTLLVLESGRWRSMLYYTDMGIDLNGIVCCTTSHLVTFWCTSYEMCFKWYLMVFDVIMTSAKPKNSYTTNCFKMKIMALLLWKYIRIVLFYV